MEFKPYQVDPDSGVSQSSSTTIALCAATLNHADGLLSNQVNSSLGLGLYDDGAMSNIGKKEGRMWSSKHAGMLGRWCFYNNEIDPAPCCCRQVDDKDSRIFVSSDKKLASGIVSEICEGALDNPCSEW